MTSAQFLNQYTYNYKAYQIQIFIFIATYLDSIVFRSIFLFNLV